jgi:spore maturation protein CgeB
MKLVFFGLSITSSWGNGHATTYRSLLKALGARGHDIVFLERDVDWYAAHRDLRDPPYATTVLYGSLTELQTSSATLVRQADAVIVGSYVPEGIALADWVLKTAHGVRAFYDIDTPITLAGLRDGGIEYLDPRAVREYDLYLSFAGGPTLQRLEQEFGAKAARVLYCSVDPSLYYPEPAEERWCLGYLGTYSSDRQGPLEQLLLEPARNAAAARFVVAGPQYPADIRWPANVERIDHLAPDSHRKFYAAQRFTLNLTRAEMVRAGFSPSVRLFEAAASGTPIISDPWPGLESVLVPDLEILVARSADDVNRHLAMSKAERTALGARARTRILSEHTSEHRAGQLESYINEVRSGRVGHPQTCGSDAALSAAP